MNTLNKNAMPVLKATKVSIFALPRLACLKALIKKLRPNQKRMGIANTKEIHLPGSHCIKNIPSTKMGSVRIADQMVRFFMSW